MINSAFHFMLDNGILAIFLCNSFLGIVTPFVFPAWVELVTDFNGETHPSGDMSTIYFQNDGVYVYFKEELLAASNTTAFTYTLYLDKPAGGQYSRDFKLVYSSSASELQQWNGTNWIYVEPIVVTKGVSPDSITFQVALSSIANPDVHQDTFAWSVNYVEDNLIHQKLFNFVYGPAEIDVGDVIITNDITNLYVEIDTDSGWEMSATSFVVSKTTIWGSATYWPYKHTLSPSTTYDLYTIPLETIGCGIYGTSAPFGDLEPEDLVYFAVHAVFESHSDAAYAGFFKGYCTTTISGDIVAGYIVQTDIPELPWPMPLIFIPAVVVTLYFMYKRRFKRVAY